MKNKIFTAILLVSLPLLLTACTLKDIPVIGNLFNKEIPDTPISMDFWGLWESEDVIDALVKDYQIQKPNVTINYDDRSVMGAAQYKETLVNRLNQGTAPDIVLVHNSWVSELRDNLAPMPTGTVDMQIYSQKFYPVISQSASFEGKVYAAPAHYDGLVLVYNKDHFDEIDQVTPPTAWEEFRRLALALTIKTEDGNFVRSGAAIGSANNIDFFSDILGLMFSQANINIPEELDTKAAQDTLSFYTMFVATDDVWDQTLPEASIAFSQGKVSMIFVPTWNLLDIVREMPGMNIGVAAVPQAVSNNPISWASFWMYAVPKTSQNVEVAWDFINHITQEDKDTLRFNESSKYRPYGAPLGIASLNRSDVLGQSSKFVKPVLDTAPFAKSGYFAARSGNTQQVDALRAAVNAVLSEEFNTKLTPEQALKNCKDILMRRPLQTNN